MRVKPPVEEPADPSRTVVLEAERIDAEHTARQALLRLHARTQPTRTELASMLVSRKIKQMERGNPAFEKDPSREGDSDSVPDRNEDARSKGWNSLWGNGVRDAEAEQNALVDVRRPPRYAFDEDERPQVERDEAYARRMDAWEKDVMAESESRDQRVSCRGPKPVPAFPSARARTRRSAAFRPRTRLAPGRPKAVKKRSANRVLTSFVKGSTAFMNAGRGSRGV